MGPDIFKNGITKLRTIISRNDKQEDSCNHCQLHLYLKMFRSLFCSSGDLACR